MSEQIKNVQRLLIAAGYDLKADGFTGRRTTAAVKDFQAKRGLVVDGIAGPKTLAALQDSEPVAVATPKPDNPCHVGEVVANDPFPECLTLVLQHEGGFVDHPDDPGGATNKGVTLATYRKHVNPNGTVGDLKNMTEQQAGAVYRAQYWDAVCASGLPAGVNYAVFDFAVNSGTRRAAKFLQRVVGATEDGVIGPETLTLVEMMPPNDIIERLCDDRLKFLKGLNHWSSFGRGWGKRVKAVRTHALGMVA